MERDRTRNRPLSKGDRILLSWSGFSAGRDRVRPSATGRCRDFRGTDTNRVSISATEIEACGAIDEATGQSCRRRIDLVGLIVEIVERMRRGRVEGRIELRRIRCLLTKLVYIQRFALIRLCGKQSRLNLTITHVDVSLPLVCWIFDRRV